MELAKAAELGLLAPTEDRASADAGLTSGVQSDQGSWPQSPLTPDKIEIDPVPDDMLLSPEMEAELYQRTGGDGTVEIASANDPGPGIDGLEAELGLEQPLAHSPRDVGLERDSETVPDDGLSPMDRAKVKWELMKEKLVTWWQENQVALVTLTIGAIAGVALAAVLTGGGIFALIPPVLSALGPVFLGVGLAMLAHYLKEFVAKSWAGQTEEGAKSLAKGIAVVVVELVSLLTARVGKAVLAGAKAVAQSAQAGARGVVRGIQSGARSVSRGANALMRSGGYAVRAGKVVFRGIHRNFAAGFKRLKHFGQALLDRMPRFSRFEVRQKGNRWELPCQINPKKNCGGGPLQPTDKTAKGASIHYRGVKRGFRDAVIEGVEKIHDQLFVKARLQKTQAGHGSGWIMLPMDAVDKLIRQGDLVLGAKLRSHLIRQRPSLPKDFASKVWERARKASPDGIVRDPNTKRALEWKPGSRTDQWHLGHIHGEEYAKLVDRFCNGEISWSQFLKEYRDPRKYQVEGAMENWKGLSEKK
jgi:hypothetical protein